MYANIMVPSSVYMCQHYGNICSSPQVEGYSTAILSALDSLAAGDQRPTRWTALLGASPLGENIQPPDSKPPGNDKVSSEHLLQAIDALRSAGLTWEGEPRVSPLAAGFCNCAFISRPRLLLLLLLLSFFLSQVDLSLLISPSSQPSIASSSILRREWRQSARETL